MKKYIVTVNGVSYEVEVEEVGTAATTAPAPVSAPAAVPTPAPQSAPAAKPAAPAPKPVQSGTSGSIKINAPMPGNILKINTAVGKEVKRGDVLCLLEAMKMENEICAPQDGKVSSINVSQGNSVGTGDLIMTLA
jgi:Biotin carboxyl carrier protein